ncbi:MAG: hypothetical protein R3324_09865 [Halobacteriales archaeon]|nr:hypothetical protein [Halobacteriales archaeon]
MTTEDTPTEVLKFPEAEDEGPSKEQMQELIKEATGNDVEDVSPEVPDDEELEAQRTANLKAARVLASRNLVTVLGHLFATAHPANKDGQPVALNATDHNKMASLAETASTLEFIASNGS